MDKKTVLVTGSSKGIGASIIREFAKNDYNVVINYNNSKEEALKLQKEVENDYDIKTLVIKCDVTKEKEIINMIDKTIEEFKRIDVLVNNAGIAIDTLFEDKTKENFMHILDVNVVGAFLVSKYASKYMLDNKSGRIINIASTNGIDTIYPESMDYDASKAALISLTHNLALQFSPYINVNAVAPGWVNTEMNKNLDQEFINNECKKILLNRFCESEEIAKVVYFLASPAANYVNSEVIRVDGGFKS